MALVLISSDQFNHEILSAFDISFEVRRIFLNILKAFDKVWHEGLIFKLRLNGIFGDMTFSKSL